MKIAYLVHDLTDPAVIRRMKMFKLGGAAVTPIGFRRCGAPIEKIGAAEPIELGATIDGRLARRALSVAGACARIPRIAQPARRADAIVARNLETLLLAVLARNIYGLEAPLVYECLDVHRLLLSDRPDGGFLRLLESLLWRHVDLLLTSSPAFTRNYFLPRRFPAPIMLVENKVLTESEIGDKRRARPPGPPWRIGWFGMIRCRRSLAMLSALTRALGGKVEVIIRGRPSQATFADFDQAIANEPYIRYGGTYRNPEDLAAIYGDVHFAWAIDYHEEGLNSAWLLPNRIYEGSLHGATPIALDEVETGRWLARRGVGVVVKNPIERSLIDFFRNLNENLFVDLSARLAAVPRRDLVHARPDCRDLVEAICAAKSPVRRMGGNPAEARLPPHCSEI